MNKYSAVLQDLVPQMADYNNCRVDWQPFVMFFHERNYCSLALNTDDCGFRLTVDSAGRDFSATSASSEKMSAIVGGSTAFGVGATSDGKSIASLLSQNGGQRWFNLGGRAFTSTQEFLLFTLFRNRLPPLEKIVILSGVNDLVIHSLSQHADNGFGSFFFLNQFFSAMKLAGLSPKRRLAKIILSPFTGDDFDFSRTGLCQMVGAVFSDRVRSDSQSGTPSPKATHDAVAWNLQRAISNWAVIGRALGVGITYALQPFSGWIDRVLSKEEDILFATLDSLPHNQFRILRDTISRRSTYEWLVRTLRGICSTEKIPFIDLNAVFAEEKLDRQWLFVDRVHMTDAGYDLTARKIAERIEP